MKVFYCMKNVNWVDRRKGEVALWLIRQNKAVTIDLIKKHVAESLFNTKSRLYQK